MATRRLFRFLFSLGGVLGAALVPVPAASQEGRIEGTVVLARSLSAPKARFQAYTDYGPGSVPLRDVGDTNELSNVVVYVDLPASSAGGIPRPQRPQTLQQLNETFVPHVLPVARGSTVEFPNGDPVFHNVFSLSSARSFDMGRYPKGESRSVTFPKAGLVQVFCHIHPDMNAIILVLDQPYFAIPGASGQYVIDNVPAGDYRLVAWHERIRPVIQEIRVLPSQTTKGDFTIPPPPPSARP